MLVFYLATLIRLVFSRHLLPFRLGGQVPGEGRVEGGNIVIYIMPPLTKV